MPKFNLTEDDAKAAIGYIEKNLHTKQPLPNPFGGGAPSADVVAAGEKLFTKRDVIPVMRKALRAVVLLVLTFKR